MAGLSLQGIVALKGKFDSNSLISHTGYLALAELVARLSRLVTVIVLAALLSTEDYGVAVLAFASFELIRCLSRLGGGPFIIQAPSDQLQVYLSSTNTLAIIISALLFISQYFLAAIIAQFYQRPEIAPILQLMAFIYFIYPCVANRAMLMQRNGQMKKFSLVTAIAICSDNLSTVVFVFIGLGLTSIALAKIIAAIAWVLMIWIVSRDENSSNKRVFFVGGFSLLPFKICHIFRFSICICGTEMIRQLRTQIDVFIAAKVLPEEWFGIYGFAKNAGVGFSQSLANSLITAAYPKLSKDYRENGSEVGINGIRVVFVGICVIFLIQAVAAQLYIPLVFGDKWSSATSIVSLLCLTAIPALTLDLKGLVLRVRVSAFQELITQIFILIIYSLSIIFLVKQLEVSSALEYSLVIVISSFVLFIGLIKKSEDGGTNHEQRR